MASALTPRVANISMRIIQGGALPLYAFYLPSRSFSSRRLTAIANEMIEQFKETVATQLGLPTSEVFGEGLSLAEVLARSPKAINSIDLMEAFAFALARHELEERLKLPAFTLNDKIDDVIAEIEQQLNAG